MDHHSPDKDYVRIFECYCATDIEFGDAAFTTLGEKLLLDGDRSLMLITGGACSAIRSGAQKAFINMASGFDLETPLYMGVPPEPDVECVRDIVKNLEREQPDAVAALGGGSVMDAAKAAYLSWQTGMDVTELFGANVASKKFPGKEFKRVICLPTTAGTGSEVTPYANIIDKSRDLKFVIMDEQIVPKGALIDPAFTRTMPNDLTAATALDAMTHSIESLLNIHAENADPDTTDWGMESVRLIRYALPRVLENPDYMLGREMLAAAATLGGMCIKNRPTSLPHLCSYSLWGKIPHGIAVALFLPVFWRYYLQDDRTGKIAERTMLLAGTFPSDNPQMTPASVVDACEKFIHSVSPVKSLSDIKGFDENLVRKIAADAVLNPVKLQSAPRKVDPKQAEKILTDLLLKTI